MIKVIIKQEKDNIKEITIKGHALYDDFGKDIVCSAVSTLTTTTINDVLVLDSSGLKYESREGFIRIYNINGNTSSKLINVMINMLSELEKDYPKNIKISKED